MKTEEIIDAYCRIRKIDNTIPDDVLDFMKDASLALSGIPNPPREWVREIKYYSAKLVELTNKQKSRIADQDEEINSWMNLAKSKDKRIAELEEALREIYEAKEKQMQPMDLVALFQIIESKKSLLP